MPAEGSGRGCGGIAVPFHRKKFLSEKRIKSFGRLAELQYIDERIFWFLNHEPSASVVIEGEVGVGKTALMQQIYEMNRDAGVLELVSTVTVTAKPTLKIMADLFKQLENLQNEGKSV